VKPGDLVECLVSGHGWEVGSLGVVLGERVLIKVLIHSANSTRGAVTAHMPKTWLALIK